MDFRGPMPDRKSMSKLVTKIFHQRVMKRAEAKGLTQDMLAGRVGMAPSTLNKMLKRGQGATLEKVRKLCAVLECEDFELLAETELEGLLPAKSYVAAATHDVVCAELERTRAQLAELEAAVASRETATPGPAKGQWLDAFIRMGLETQLKQRNEEVAFLKRDNAKLRKRIRRLKPQAALARKHAVPLVALELIDRSA